MALDPGSEKEIVLECSNCYKKITLPPVPGRPNVVSITNMDGWTAPPLLCPGCSSQDRFTYVRQLIKNVGGDDTYLENEVQPTPREDIPLKWR
jgi:TPP-dependent indolepyruvate ferredoxin oxidoreductase alpha subunit